MTVQISGSHTITPTCDGRSSGVTATDWGFRSTPCSVSLGLRTLTDAQGVERRFCAAHEADVERRYGRRYVSEIADDGLGQAKAEAIR